MGMSVSSVKLLIAKMADPDPDKEVLTHALGLSTLVYFSDTFIQKSLMALNMPYKILSFNEMKCLIAETDKNIFISFRGTEPSKWANWKRILNIWPKPFVNNLKVHGGFELYFKEYEGFVGNYINNINKPKNIIFTGHSMGAAIASMFNISYEKTSSTINFASPNYLFNSKFIAPNSVSYRIVKDFVTWIPPDMPFIDWSRAAHTIKIKSSYNGINLIDYHSIGNYVKSILGF